MLSADATLQEIEFRYGPFGRVMTKPYARSHWADDGGSLLKVYVSIDPEGRRAREADTVRRAADWGLSVPVVLATGRDDLEAWTVFRVLPGSPCGIDTSRAVEAYIGRVLALTDRLHRPAAGLIPGPGWADGAHDPAMQSAFLLDQLSASCRSRPWWDVLARGLQPLDSQPVVYLHGDLKPEHLLVDDDQLHVVDWEASARGPAAADFADVVFHLVRDMVYEATRQGPIPIDHLTRLPFSGPALAWRLLLWLDRRRPSDIDLIATDDLYRLLDEGQPTAAYRSLVRTVLRLRATGVPR